jgi:hypothetical protein
MSESIVELIKSVIRPLGLLTWLVIRALCTAQGVEIEVSFLVVGLDAATLEYFGERAYKRIKETKNGVPGIVGPK